MQAYASAELSPRANLRLAPAAAAEPTKAADIQDGVAGSFNSSASPASLLGSLLIDGLDERDLVVLARRLSPYLAQAASPRAGSGNTAYTVASLAAELGVSQKAIRCAIGRRELPAVKRGSRWIISSDAVQAWASASGVRRRGCRAGAAVSPRAAGPSLRSVLCEDATRGAAR